MKAKIYAVGETVIDLDAEYQEPDIRAAIEDGDNDVPSVIIDCTDTERSNISHDEYAVVTEDDGTERWRGWLGMGRQNIPAPDAALRDALAALAAKWKQREAEFREAAKRDPRAEITEVERCQTAIAHHFGEHARQLLDAMGGAQ